MAVIKYTLDSSTTPAYITDGGYFRNPSDDTLIGIGSGGGTELTKAELVTRVQSFSALYPKSFTFDALNDAGEGLPLGYRQHIDTSTIRPFTDAEYETQVNDWCTSKGL